MITELPESAAAGGFRLPKVYAVSQRYQVLRLCERFGMDPIIHAERFLELNHADLAELVAYDAIRRLEEVREG